MSGASKTSTPRRTKTKHPNIWYRDTPDGRRYEITYIDSDGVRRWPTIEGGLREAKAALADVKSKLNRGERVAPTKMTVDEAARLWLEAQTQLRPRTRGVYETSLRVHVLPRFGRWKVSDVTVDDVARLIAEIREAGRSAWTIRGVLVPLGRVFDFAVRRGAAPHNPIARLDRSERPRSVRRDYRILDGEEITRLLDAALPRFRPLLATAVFTGLRQGELLGLRWQDVDFDAGVVHVRLQLDRDRKLVEPKTPESVREVVLMPALARMLREHQLASAFSQPEHFVFSTERGGPMLWRNVTRRAFAAAVERAELEANGKRRPTFHDLRRTFGSLLIYQGEDIVYVSRQMGHSSPKVTLDIYARLFNAREHAARARARMESTFGNLLETSGGEQRRTASVGDTPKVAQLRASATDGD